MRLTVVLSIIFLLLSGSIYAADPVKDSRNIDEFHQPGENSPLVPSEYVWFFGYIPTDGWVAHSFSLTNNHEDTVTILKFIPGCDCTHVPRTPITFAPGETKLVKIDFDTKTYSGETNRDVHVMTDYKVNPNLDLYFASVIGMRPRTVKISPASTVFIAGKEKQTISVINLIDEDVDVKIIIDMDSSLSVSKASFELEGEETVEFDIIPNWDKVGFGPQHYSVTVEFEREDAFRISIPVKTNKF
ncbi:MAG: DUF1573 domain-containing protein [candidate division Zixibacteria bacterium]|nr:DUF1573 domain-containing protein [candidate division Zixibacteria bacterium]